MITPSTLPLFPGCPTFGFTSRAQYLVKKIEREGGFERRDLKWREPLHYYEGVPIGKKPQADIESVLRFWHALTGEFVRFRFKDWVDYKSCALDATPGPTDQPIQALTGSPGAYKLSKQYVEGLFATVRTNILPKGDTIRIANESGVEQASSTWTIEEDTGYLTTTGGFSGTPTTWGGEFYVPVRFDTDPQFEIVSHKVQSVTVTLRELRPET